MDNEIIEILIFGIYKHQLKIFFYQNFDLKTLYYTHLFNVLYRFRFRKNKVY